MNVPDFETGDALAKQRATVAAQAARQGLQLFALADGRLLLVRADLQRVVPDLRAARLVLAQLAEGAT